MLHSAGSQGGVDVKVMWNPNVQNWNTTNPLQLYPGNQYVDVIAADLYDNIYPYSLDNLGKGDGSTASGFAEWASDPANLAFYYSHPAATRWTLDSSQGHSMSLRNLLDFTRQQGKPFAIAETGAGGSGASEPNLRDDATFPQWLAKTLAASGLDVKFVNIWDVNYEGAWSYSDPDANKSNEAASWAQNLGGKSGNPAAPPTPTPDTSNSDVLTLSVSEDAWLGDAQFTVAIDGTTIGGLHTATASHAAGASQAFSFPGNWGAGPHTVGVTFINDAWGGSASADRNLHVNRVAYDGRTASGAPAALGQNGTANFTVPAADAWQGDAQFFVSIDGRAVTQPATVTASNTLGQSQTVSLQAAPTPGTHDVSVTFLNDG